MADEPPYKMSISLDVLNHLGTSLYSNVPAVISEAVANAWDADATRVEIDMQDEHITIKDNGHGMSLNDANKKYLVVGYRRREEEGGRTTPRLKRPVMGRKGIGKLSLFSIAKTVTVYSIKDGHLHGFRMNTESIKDNVGQVQDYYPEPVDVKNVTLRQGTKIVLSELKRRRYKSGHLRRRLARRFSVIRGEDEFEVSINGDPITPKDRAYYEKLQYIWTFGKLGKDVASKISTVKKHELPVECSAISPKERIDGWIGTVRKASQAKDVDTGESLNAISVMVRGKVAQEDILEEFGEGGVYSKYIIGEIHADFLDMDDMDDTATTGRQHLIEDDPRYKKLKEKIGCALKHVEGKWSEYRHEDGPDEALAYPHIKEWYDTLGPDHKSVAKKLFGRINKYAIDDDNTKRCLFIGSIITFETLKFRNMLDLLKTIKVDNLQALGDVFRQLDEIEAQAYYQITKDRLEVIKKFSELADVNAKERAIQEYLFDHLWLLDPSWERATHTESMEKRVSDAFEAVDDNLTDEQKKSRLDIKYTTTGNKHVIIELKRPERILTTDDIQSQIRKYYGAVTNALKDSDRNNGPLEFICVLGRKPSDWSSYEKAEQNARNALKEYDARIVTYNQLIINAEKAYREYTEQTKNITRLHKLIEKIRQADIDAMSTSGSNA